MTDLENKLIAEIQSLNGKFDKLLEVFLSVKGGSTENVSSKTYGDWLVEWFNLYKASKGLKLSYLKKIEYYINNYILKALGDIKLCDLNAVNLQEYINSFTALNTCKKIALIINESLEKAVSLRLIPHNYFSAVDMPKFQKQHYKPLEYVEQNLLLKEIRKEKYIAVFWVLCCTGMRIGELLAIDYNKDIDWFNRTITINKDMDIHTGIINSTPKTLSSKRKIPFLSSLVQYLKILQFENLTYNSVRLYFKRLYTRLKLKGLNLHSFRHTFISLCCMAEMPVKVTQNIVGHASVEMTLNVYSHVLNKGNSPLLGYVNRLKKEVGF